MNRAWSAFSATHLSILQEIAENALSVIDLAETELKWLDPDCSAGQALTWMQEHGFDAAPIDEQVPHRVAVAERILPNDQPISLQAQPLDASLLVSSDLSLADGIARLKRQQFYFVLQRDQLHGIVTRADLERPAVSMIIFSFILAAEAAMRELIGQHMTESWIEKLKPKAKEKLEEIYSVRIRHNTENTKLDCLMIHDSMSMLPECIEILGALGFTKTKFKYWKETLRQLRDTLAHGGGLLSAVADPLKAIQLFEDARSFAGKSTSLAATNPLAEDAALAPRFSQP